MWIDYEAPRNLLVSVKGHAFDRPAFSAMLDAIADDRPDLTWTLVEQPATDALIEADALSRFAAILFYDMPGLSPPREGVLELAEPSETWKAGFERLLSAGKPMIFLHHALAGWPAWPRYAEVMGGRFLFQPLPIDGELIPDSGYRHDVVHTVTPAGAHPVTAGLKDGFTLEDELYLFDVFEDDVLPLMVSDHVFTPEAFFSSAQAVAGRMHSNDGWSRSPGSRLFAWARREGASPILSIQGGHGPTAYGSPDYRRLLGASIDWITSDAARAWVQAAASGPTFKEFNP